MWFQCTKGHKWWVQGRADAFPAAFRDEERKQLVSGGSFDVLEPCPKDCLLDIPHTHHHSGAYGERTAGRWLTLLADRKA